MEAKRNWLPVDHIYLGDSRAMLKEIEPDSVACSIWSPPYHTGKSYERDLSFDEGINLLWRVIELHFPILKPGGFLAINIADILSFQDPEMPKIQAENLNKKRSSVTRDEVLGAMNKYPNYSRDQLAAVLNCSEQTIDRRLHGNNARGGKLSNQTRVKLVGGILEEAALSAGLYLYDRRVWIKDPAWANCQWHSVSYRSVDEFEYIYIFWKPGVTQVNRNRLEKGEWGKWGSRGAWYFPSVRANREHEAMFPEELPRRLIRLLTDPGEVILDCFVGSGTTAVAAIKEGRRFIGIDLTEKYVEVAKRNCKKALESQKLDVNPQLIHEKPLGITEWGCTRKKSNGTT